MSAMPAMDGAGDESAPLCRVEGGPPLPHGEARYVVTRAGRRVRVARFEPAGTARGSVVVSTGRTEPLEKYGEVASELVGRGFVVLMHDWAGQGLSDRFPGDRLRGDLVGGASSLVEDFKDVLTASAERLPQPWFTCAHSMGAALTCLALSEGETRFAGAALSAPMIEFTVGKLPFWMIRMVVLGMSSLREAELARSQVDPASVHFAENLLTHDRERYERSVALYRAHPELRVGEPTWRWLRFGVEIRERLVQPGAAERIRCPVAVLGASDDQIVSTEAIRRFAARLPQGTYSEVPGSFHEILMETDARRGRFWQAFDGLVTKVLATVLIAFATIACSSGDDDDDASAQCTSLRSEGLVGANLEYDGAAEPSTGGVVEEGTYRLTAYNVYLASNSQVLPRCNALSDVLLLSTGGFEHAVSCYFDADDPDSRLGGGVYAGSYFVSSTDFSFNYTCPNAQVETFSYSAEPTTLRLLSPDPTGSLTTELVWTRE